MYICLKCKRVFEQKPEQHGDFIVDVLEDAKDEKCDGEVVLYEPPRFINDDNFNG